MDEIEVLLKRLKDLFEALDNELDFSDEPLPVGLCREMPCLGSPEEIAELINTGYGYILHRAAITAIVGNGEKLVGVKKIPVVQLRRDKDGCAMYKDGKCLLMQSGRTPVMGKLHLLTGGLGARTMKFLIHTAVMEWLNPNNAPQVRFCMKSLEMIEKNLDSNHTN